MQICHWYTPADEPGARIMIPGCMTRVDDPDRCTCEVTAEEMIRLRGELAQKDLAYNRMLAELRALDRAVFEHPDARKIIKRSEDLRNEHRRRAS